MEARELRIGNLIYDLNFKEVIEVNTTVLDQIDMEISDKINHPKVSFKPIPITEDWLLRFGLQKNYGFYFYNNIYRVSLKGKYLQIIKRCQRAGETQRGECGDSIIIRVENVHTLQNAIFALTGKELELKEK